VSGGGRGVHGLGKLKENTRNPCIYSYTSRFAVAVSCYAVQDHISTNASDEGRLERRLVEGKLVTLEGTVVTGKPATSCTANRLTPS
jgi:hypothetical protein